MQGEICPYTYRPQSLVAAQVSRGSTQTLEPDCTGYFHNPQFMEDADSISFSGHSFVWYDPEIDGYWTQYHEGFQLQPPPAFLGLKDVPPASIEATHVNSADMDITYTAHMSMSAFSDQSYPYAPVDNAPNFQVSPTFGTQQPLSTANEYESSSFLSDEEPENPFPFKCSRCPKRFALRQSVGRHYRKRHDPNTCLFSNDGCTFTWGGPYDYGRHLKGQHKLKDEVISAIMGKPAESRCRAKIVGRKPLPPPLYIAD